MVMLIAYLVAQGVDLPVHPTPLSEIHVERRMRDEVIGPFVPIAVLISGYRAVLSSQQGDVCNFSPSCSEYGYNAINKYGVTGLLMTFDRLERCHSHAWRYRNIYYYEQTDEHGKVKLHDPPEPDTVSDL